MKYRRLFDATWRDKHLFDAVSAAAGSEIHTKVSEDFNFVIKVTTFFDCTTTERLHRVDSAEVCQPQSKAPQRANSHMEMSFVRVSLMEICRMWLIISFASTLGTRPFQPFSCCAELTFRLCFRLKIFSSSFCDRHGKHSIEQQLSCELKLVKLLSLRWRLTHLIRAQSVSLLNASRKFT